MSLRLIEVFLPNIAKNTVQELLKDQLLLGIWRDQLSEHVFTIKILLPAEETEEVLDLLQKNFHQEEGFRILILPVEATIPRPASLEKRLEEKKLKEMEREQRQREKEQENLEMEKEKEATEIDTGKAEGNISAVGAVTGEPEEQTGPHGDGIIESLVESARREISSIGKRLREKIGLEKIELRAERVAREELYANVQESVKFTWVYLAMIVLSTIVASVGILRNNVAVIIGAMVIAPMLGPNVALSLATTLGDTDLARRALKATLVGLFIALLLTILLGLFISTFYDGINLDNPDMNEVKTRTEVSMGDVALALAAGSAAALSFTKKAMSALIGVMVAVALLPPLVVLGVLAGCGEWGPARGAALLLLINLIGINLSGVVVFLAQGIRPLRWWEADRARRATRVAIALWSVLLLILVVVIIISQQ